MLSATSSQVTLKERERVAEKEELDWKPDWRLKCIFGIIGLLNFVTAVDATSISVSLPVSYHLSITHGCTILTPLDHLH